MRCFLSHASTNLHVARFVILYYETLDDRAVWHVVSRRLNGYQQTALQIAISVNGLRNLAVAADY